MFLQDLFIAIIEGTGVLALMAILFGVIERQDWPRWTRSILQGLVFGIGGIVTIMSPTHIGGGVMVDSRGIVIGFAAAFGGWPAALVAGAMAAAYRGWLGGSGALPGVVGICAAALLGLGWRHWLRPRSAVKARHLFVLGVVVSCYVLTGAVMGYASAWSLITQVGPFVLLASVVAAVLLGLFVERELAQILREQEWKTRALTDPLTALPNRRAFERGIAGLRHPDRLAALLIIDLDHFKIVNDTFGHAAGDHVLQQVSRVLRASLRGRDLLSRLGGEELAVLLPDTTVAITEQVAERLRQAIDGLDLVWEGQPIHISASFGVSMARGDLPAEDLFAQADAALYAAKRGGRNRVVFSGDMLSPTVDEIVLELDRAQMTVDDAAPPRAA
ncbi:GGDEF domain-containing protein [Devosia aquimaris]|uniref:GGDEF domain-containing protein n=1 Tax=Devosia aquimaris TaxID=2866214 RepID=UPI001CD1046C|nr:sensor domain-containing diguanylate cyclase [Devosia sp. CJK-A8-3]